MNKIFHYLGNSRNFGDNCIEYSTRNLIKEQLNSDIEFTTYSSDLLTGTDTYGHPAPLLDTPQAKLINQACSMALIGPGGQLMSRPLGQSVGGWQFNATKEFIKELTVPLVVSSVGYNKFPGEPDFLYSCSDHLKYTYEKSSLFSVRNKGTAEKLKSIGINAEVVPDPVTFIKNDLGKLKIPGITDDDFVIGLNLAGDAPTKRFSSENECCDFYFDIFKFCTEFLEEIGGGKVLYIPHVTIYDLLPIPVLKNLFGNNIICLNEACPWIYPENLFNVPFLLSAYQRCNMVLGQRGHANIIPFALNVPSFGIGNQEKVKYFQDDVGGMCLGMKPYESLNTVYELVVKNGRQYSLLRQKKQAELKRISDSFYKKVVGLL
jgi:polysaccharide pyruvyl transferase WcaK-like protein